VHACIHARSRNVCGFRVRGGARGDTAKRRQSQYERRHGWRKRQPPANANCRPRRMAAAVRVLASSPILQTTPTMKEVASRRMRELHENSVDFCAYASRGIPGGNVLKRGPSTTTVDFRDYDPARYSRYSAAILEYFANGRGRSAIKMANAYGRGRADFVDFDFRCRDAAPNRIRDR